MKTHYAERDHSKQGKHYMAHVSAMTGETLHSKSAIAAELAHRDIEIERLRAALSKLCTELEDDESHGAGAYDTGCSICEAIAEARVLVPNAEIRGRRSRPAGLTGYASLLI